MASPTAEDHVEAAIHEIEKLRSNLKKNGSKQVQSFDERAIVKATAQSWFNNHFPIVQRAVGIERCQKVCDDYHKLIDYTDKSTIRTKYQNQAKSIRSSLSDLRKEVIRSKTLPSEPASSDMPPDFSSLIGDQEMQGILTDRWAECVVCIRSGAPLAATVMMGGLLETLLLARINQEHDKAKVFSATTAPLDKVTKKPLLLKEWSLRHYLDVSHELGWIGRAAKDVGEVLRDYRNFVHPYKQARHNVRLSVHDSQLLWDISKAIARQLLARR